MEGGRRGQRLGEEKGKKSRGMMQVGAGLPCKARLGKEKMVKPLHQREVQRGWLIAWLRTRARPLW